MMKTSFCAFGRSCNLFIAAVALIAANATTASAVPSSASDDIPSGLTEPQKQLMQRRMANAQELIDEEGALQVKAQALHRHVEQLIAQATKLKGEAQVLHANLTAPPAIKLSPAQLKAAQSSYKDHIDQFRAHAEAYQAHLQDLRNTVGECHANQAAYQTFANQVTLHVAQFHIPVPDVPPPHVCRRMGMSSMEMSHTANALAGDIKRVEQSEADLAVAQNKLQSVEALSPGLDNKAGAEAVREQKEQALAGEFGKLREEYDLLRAEGNILAKNGSGFASGGAVTRASVSGKVKQQ
jgi:chromosome segregation ATPase